MKEESFAFSFISHLVSFRTNSFIPVVCLEDHEVGECQGSFNRWYFDNRKFMCLPFIYSGCRGNKNNFITLEDCHHSCGVIKGK